MKFNPDEIKEATKKDFDTAWNEGKKYIINPGLNEKYPRVSLKYGKPHPVFDTIQRLREAYMRMGFEEFMNPIIIEDRDVHKQFGYEALAVLEATKSVANKIRQKSGLIHDGAELAQKAFSLGKTGKPVLAINTLSTETETGEQRGFVNLLVGLFGTFRNPTAHAEKIYYSLGPNARPRKNERIDRYLKIREIKI